MRDTTYIVNRLAGFYIGQKLALKDLYKRQYLCVLCTFPLNITTSFTD